MHRSISQWIHRFGSAAIDALKDEYQSRGLETATDRASFVIQMLGKEDLTDKERPFLWKSTDETGWNKKDKKSVCRLQSSIVSQRTY